MHINVNLHLLLLKQTYFVNFSLYIGLHVHVGLHVIVHVICFVVTSGLKSQIFIPKQEDAVSLQASV